MRKKVLSILLAGAMALSLAACGSKENADNTTLTPAPTEEATPSTEPGQEENTENNQSAEVDFDVNEMMNLIAERVDLPAMMEGGETELTELYGIAADKVEAFAIRVPMMNVTATELAVFKASSDEAVEDVKAGVQSRIDNLIEQWSTYLPAQLALVENNKVLVQGRYVFLIIAEEETSAYAENVFLRKFDPSIEEIVLVRKFKNVSSAVIKELTEDKLVVEYVEEGKTYTFDCSFSEYFYAENGIETYAVGDEIEVYFETPVPETDGTMEAVTSMISKPYTE